MGKGDPVPLAALLAEQWKDDKLREISLVDVCNHHGEIRRGQVSIKAKVVSVTERQTWYPIGVMALGNDGRL